VISLDDWMVRERPLRLWVATLAHLLPRGSASRH